MSQNPNPKSPKKLAVPSDPDAMLYTVDEVAAHPLIRSSKTFVWAIKMASKGTADNPFNGRVTTARLIKDWVFRHKDFVPSHWSRKKQNADRIAKKRAAASCVAVESTATP